jgi:hypothetical protein
MTKNIKAVKFEVCAVIVTCPYCREAIENPTNGALNWTNQELIACENTTIECTSCAEKVNVPEIVTFMYKVAK